MRAHRVQYSTLRLRAGKRVIPIAPALYPSRAGVALEEYIEGAFDRTYLTLSFPPMGRTSA